MINETNYVSFFHLTKKKKDQKINSSRTTGYLSFILRIFSFVNTSNYFSIYKFLCLVKPQNSFIFVDLKLDYKGQ